MRQLSAVLSRQLKNLRLHGAWLVAVLAIGGVSGCVDGFSELGASGSEPVQTMLLVGEEYEVFANSQLEPDDEDTRISVRHELDSDKTYVTLLAGGATLIQGDATQEGTAP